MVGVEAVEPWSAELESLFRRVGGRFARREPRQRMRDDVRGLLGPDAPTAGSWPSTPHMPPQTGSQRLLASSRWDRDELRDDVREVVAERLGEVDAVLIVDDTGFLAKGTTSAGMARQYTGTSGKVDNGQIAVFAAYASRRGRALIDRELYLPKSQAGDAHRCTAAKIPASRGFATEPELARAMVTRILDTGDAGGLGERGRGVRAGVHVAPPG